MNQSKHISELSGEEIAKVGQRAVKKIREVTFARGQSVVWDRKGLVVREHPDGSLEILKHTPKAK